MALLSHTGIDTDQCSGCTGCVAACRKAAVTMVLTAEGYYRPTVDASRCIQCGACAKVCPSVHPFGGDPAQRLPAPESFTAWATSSDWVERASSGGLAPVLAEDVLARGGVFAGVVWGEHLRPRHVLIREPDSIAATCGSKYLPSDVGDTFRLLVGEIRDGRDVLLVGTPCQIAAFENLLSPSERPHALLVTFVCQGVPSLTAFHAYLDTLFGGRKVVAYAFRPEKRLGSRTIHAVSETGEVYHQPSAQDAFGIGRALALSLFMPACFRCVVQQQGLQGDIIIGDYHGKQQPERPGVSIACVNTLKGRETFQRLREAGAIACEPYALATLQIESKRIAGHMHRMHPLRPRIMADVSAGMPFGRLMRKYNFLFRLSNLLRRFGGKGG